jgi:methionine-rich copper-binding protein CopC
VTWFGKLTTYPLVRLTVLVAAILIPAAALAHADYERAEPAAAAVVAEAPTQVRIWFTQDLFRREGMNRIEVYNAAEQRVDQDDPTIDDDNRRLMTVSLLPDLADGVYTVRWYSLSSDDGHEGEGEFTFTVDTTGSMAATDAVTTTITATTTAEVTTTAVTATDLVTATETVSAAVEAEPTAEASPTAEPAPTETPASQSPGLQCFGVAVPLMLALSVVLARRRDRH